MTDDERSPSSEKRVSTWAIVVAGALGLGVLICFVVGIALSSGKGQTPTQSYVLTVLLTILSIGAGWIIALILQQIKDYELRVEERHRKSAAETAARSAVTRIFRNLGGLGRIREAAGDGTGNIAEVRSRLERVSSISELVFEHTKDSITDWERIAPKAVQEELAIVRDAATRREA